MQNQEWLDSLIDLVECWGQDIEEINKILAYPHFTSDQINLLHEVLDNLFACSHIGATIYERFNVQFKMGDADINVHEDDYNQWT